MSKADILESLRSLYASSCYIAAEAVAERAIESGATVQEIADVTDTHWAVSKFEATQQGFQPLTPKELEDLED